MFISDTKSETFQFLLGHYHQTNKNNAVASNASSSYLSSMTNKFSKEAGQFYIHHSENYNKDNNNNESSSRFDNFLLASSAVESYFSVLQIALAANLDFGERKLISTKNNNSAPPCLPLLKMLGHRQQPEKLEETPEKVLNFPRPTLQQRLDFIMMLDKRRRRNKKQKKKLREITKQQQHENDREKSSSSRSPTDAGGENEEHQQKQKKKKSSSTSSSSTTSITSSESEEDDDDEESQSNNTTDEENNIDDEDNEPNENDDETPQDNQIDENLINQPVNNLVTLDNISFALSCGGTAVNVLTSTANNNNRLSPTATSHLVSAAAFQQQQQLQNSNTLQDSTYNNLTNSASDKVATSTTAMENTTTTAAAAATAGSNFHLIQQQLQRNQSQIQNNTTTTNHRGSFTTYGSFNVTGYGPNVQYVHSEAGSFRVPQHHHQQYHNQTQNHQNSFYGQNYNMMMNHTNSTANPFLFGSQNQMFSSGAVSGVDGEETPPAIPSEGISRTNTATGNNNINNQQLHNHQPPSSNTNMNSGSMLSLTQNAFSSNISSPFVPAIYSRKPQQHQRLPSNASSSQQHQLFMNTNQNRLALHQSSIIMNNNNNLQQQQQQQPTSIMRHMRTASGVEKLQNFEQCWYDSPQNASEMLLERLNNIVSVLESFREQQQQQKEGDNNNNNENDETNEARSAFALLSSSQAFIALTALDEEELVGHVTDEIDAINSFASAAARIAMDPVRDCFMRADKALSSAEKKVAKVVTKMEKKKKL